MLKNYQEVYFDHFLPFWDGYFIHLLLKFCDLAMDFGCNRVQFFLSEFLGFTAQKLDIVSNFINRPPAFPIL
jgi:hypothetical protein